MAQEPGFRFLSSLGPGSDSSSVVSASLLLGETCRCPLPILGTSPGGRLQKTVSVHPPITSISKAMFCHVLLSSRMWTPCSRSHTIPVPSKCFPILGHAPPKNGSIHLELYVPFAGWGAAHSLCRFQSPRDPTLSLQCSGQNQGPALSIQP